MTSGAIILAGGRSRRMGTSKALLEWRGSTLLGHTVGVVGDAVTGSVIVVCAAGQELPALPDGVRIVEDAHPGAGPLAALATGLAALEGCAERVFVCGVDTPFLTPAFILVLLDALTDEVDIALPLTDGRRHPLPAALRIGVLPIASGLVNDGQRALHALADRCRIRDVGADELRAADPAHDALRNLNDRAAYEAARAELAPDGTRS